MEISECEVEEGDERGRVVKKKKKTGGCEFNTLRKIHEDEWIHSVA